MSTASNYGIVAAPVSNTKNNFAASNDGAVQVMTGYDYVYAGQSLAAGASITFTVYQNPVGLKGVYFVEIEASPFVPALSIGLLGNLNSASATGAVGGINAVLNVPGGTFTIASTATGITVTASAGVTGGPYNMICAVNRIGS
jgi:hypothetical protein